MSATLSKKVIKPLNPAEVDFDNVSFGTLKVNSSTDTKWVDLSYNNESKKFLTVVRGCVIKSFKKSEYKGKDGDKPSSSKGDKPRAEKYDVFLAIKDPQFIEFQKEFDEKIIAEATKNSVSWFEVDFGEEECRTMNKSFLIHNEKYNSYAIGCSIYAKDFICKNKADPDADCSNLLETLTKNTVIDICLNYHRVKVGKDKYSADAFITQANIVGVADASEYVSSGVTGEDFQSGKITLTSLEENENHGRFCKAQYDGKGLRLKFNNVAGRVIRFEKEGTVSYSLNIKLTDPANLNMIKSIDKEIFDKLLANSKDYYGTKKTAKLLERSVIPLVSFSKEDKERIAKGESPKYEPSLWIKIYYNEEKGFDGKIKNSADGSVLNNLEDILNKDLNIAELEVYSRHVWFGAKGTSTNLTLNRCMVVHQTLSYDMDDVEEDGEDEVVEDEEAADSSDDE